MKSFSRIVWLFVLTGLCAACAGLQGKPAAGLQPTLALTDCTLSNSGTGGSQVHARCGSLDVAEDRTNPGGRKIALNIAVIPAVSRSPEPDPLFILAGGPGQSAVEIGPAIYSAMSRVHKERDIVLVDQRGTGKSNPLRCKIPEEIEDTITEAEAIQLMKDCPASLDADLRFYTTPIAMQDLDEVRAALGYETINLYGGSYGTRAGLTYLRMYPDRVRSVVLDGVVSPTYVLYLNTPRDAQRALNMAYERCNNDEACRSAFPNFQSELEGLMKQVKDQPVHVKMDHPVTGKPYEFDLSESMLTNAVFALLYEPEMVSLLPLAIHTASEGNFAPLFTEAGGMDAGLYNGMFYSVVCSEDNPLVGEGQSQETSLADMTRAMREVCSDWPSTILPPDFRNPLPSTLQTPVLILSGEVDPVTPPLYGEQVAKMLPNSRHIIAPGMGHGVATRGCFPRLVADFIKSASAKDLDTACVQNIKADPFFISFTGPKP